MSGGRIAMVASLPELMPEEVCERLARGGVVGLNGLHEAIGATVAATQISPPEEQIILP